VPFNLKSLNAPIGLGQKCAYVFRQGRWAGQDGQVDKRNDRVLSE
jgi:hypothetical protein